MRGSLRAHLRVPSVRQGFFLLIACAATWTTTAVAAAPETRSGLAVLAAVSLAMHARLAVGAPLAIAQLGVTAAGLFLGSVSPGGLVTIGVAGLVGLAAVRRFGGRRTLLRLGAAIAVVAALTLWAWDRRFAGSPAPWTEVVAVALGGFGSVLLLLALGPVFEAIFGHSTRLTLTDWLGFDHPLLRELARVAPGTLQHSVNVGVLGSAAAQAVGADALLVRVAALYHDVGKSAAPQYFIENQEGTNPHDDLPPAESARLVRAHVPDGVARVLAHGMGNRMADFVREHHGTSLMRGFVAKARRLSPGADPDPATFRYDGPRPRSRETGILMIADQVEATARSAPPADLAACQQVVTGTLERLHGEHQLADSGLTLRDLERVAEAVTRALHAMYHRRILYPGQRPSVSGAAVSETTDPSFG